MPEFIKWPYKVTNGVAERTTPDRLADILNAEDFGSIADGNSHPLSTRYASLAQAQLDYPFATSLNQEIDFCACKQMSNVAFGPDGSENGSVNSWKNKRIFLDEGFYIFGDDEWLIRNLQSGMIEGNGKRATVLQGNKRVLAFDGVWYTRLANFSIQCVGSGPAALDLDGNVPGHPYTTRGVQGVTLQNVHVSGGGTCPYGIAIGRTSLGAGQGSECAFINCHLDSCTTACYSQVGFAALDNIFIGGDIQNYPLDGMNILSGTCHVYGTSFESLFGIQQVINDGWDIRTGDAGVFQGCVIHGCRSESMHFLHNGGANFAAVSGVSGRNAGSNAATTWLPSNAYHVGDQFLNFELGQVRASLFIVTVAGTSGLVQPTWPTAGAGNVTDGGVTWQRQNFNFIENSAGTTDFNSCCTLVGNIVGTPVSAASSFFQIGAITPAKSPYTMTDYDEIITVDARTGPVTIVLPFLQYLFQKGRQITIKNAVTAANDVTINSTDGMKFDNGTTTDTISGGTLGWRTYMFDLDPDNAPCWYTMGTG